MPILTTHRSLLFVPGNRPDRFDKAASADADTIIIDLEDAVAPDGKDDARAAALGWLGARSESVSAGLRINSVRTPFGCADIAALARQGVRVDFVMVPKAETGVDLEIVAEALGERAALIGLIESGRGVSNAHAIAAAGSGVLFGGADFSASLGAELADWDAMIHARGMIAAACGAAGVPAYDVPYLDVKDVSGLEETTMRARRMGFAGRACIHPGQVETVNRVYTPSADEVAEAREILAVLEAAGGGVALHKGKMIDRPVELAARRIVELSEN